jgi:hypothetical protein
MLVRYRVAVPFPYPTLICVPERVQQPIQKDTQIIGFPCISFAGYSPNYTWPFDWRMGKKSNHWEQVCIWWQGAETAAPFGLDQTHLSANHRISKHVCQRLVNHVPAQHCLLGCLYTEELNHIQTTKRCGKRQARRKKESFTEGWGRKVEGVSKEWNERADEGSDPAINTRLRLVMGIR